VKTTPTRTRLAVSALLVLVVAAIYAPVRHHAFLDLDDAEYVYENPHVLGGLTAEGISWAFTTFHAANWHPVTWLSHQLDAELYGADAGGHHVTNVLLHAANSVLLFLVLESLTGAAGRSAAVAALFAAHPLRVESVAWVAERKDLLCALFGLLALAAWTAWCRRGGTARYLAAAALFALGLMAKPMLVTLPFVLLLLDRWPLGRWRGRADLWPRMREKIPLFALSAASSGITYVAQSQGRATGSQEAFPWLDRLANALVAYASYLVDLVWPSGLAVFYPHPNALGERVDGTAALLAALALAAGTAAVAWQWRRRPWLGVGWLVYLGMLVPAIGLVQVGAQARADRYTYLPTIGILLVAVWGASELASTLRLPRGVPAGAAIAAILALALVSMRQVATWRDAPALYGHAIAVTERNYLAWNNLGVWNLNHEQPQEALRCWEQAVRAKPDYALAWFNAGLALNRMNEHARAIAAYVESLRLSPDSADAWGNLGSSYRVLGRRAEAVDAYRRALAIRPDHPVALEGFARMGLAPPASPPATRN